MSDYISRADAIDAVAEEWLSEASAESPYVNDNDIDRYRELAEELFADIPSADAVDVNDVTIHYKPYPSADAEPKWNCTANFVAEQLDRLRKMTDEERWDFFIKFFSPSADRPTEDYSDLPDIPRAYYEKIVGNMAHEINMLKEQLESAEAVQGEWLPIEETLPTYDGGEKTWLTGMKCSNCGELFDLRVGYYYCPSCGAIMKGGNE